jgi:hypothetical protein
MFSPSYKSKINWEVFTEWETQGRPVIPHEEESLDWWNPKPSKNTTQAQPILSGKSIIADTTVENKDLANGVTSQRKYYGQYV